MRIPLILLLAASCAGERAERPNSGSEELQRMREDQVRRAPLHSLRQRSEPEDWIEHRREQATRERAEARTKECEYRCDESRAACEARCADDPRCLARCPESLTCRANCQ